MDNIVIRFDNVSKKFFRQEQRTLKELIPALFKKEKAGEFIVALKDISFEVKKGETLGVIGRNGAGKSTLLKLIAGVTKPTNGKVKVSGRVSPLIELGAGFHPELTGRENIYLNGAILGLSRKEIDKNFKEIVDFSEMKDFIEMSVKHYSSGMYARLGFSVAVHVNPEILLIDEVLAVGDIPFQQKCLQKMEEFKRKGVTIIFVSHALGTVRSFCSKTVWLEEGKIKNLGVSSKVVDSYKEIIKQ